MKKIICVCTENTCRSPMLEVILKKKLKQANLTNIKVDSAGVYAISGTSIEPNSKKVINEHGYRVGNRKAKQLKMSMVDQNTLLLTVSSNHKSVLKNIEKVVALSELKGGYDIPDPYGKDIEVYRHCYELLDDITDIVVDYIKNGKLRW